MFISLSVENYRSIKDKLKLSLESSRGKNLLSENIYFPESSTKRILKTAGIYGANASGKSNVLLAFNLLFNMVTKSGDLKEGESIPWYDPYLLSQENSKMPTILEVEFLLDDDTRHIYKISFNSEEILSETLDFYPNRSKANIFTRYKDDTWEEIKFGGNYKGGNKRIPFFKNNSYLSKAGNNASSPDMIRNVYNFFRKCIHLNINERFRLANPSYEIMKSFARDTSDLLNLFDTGIDKIEVEVNDDFHIPEEFKNKLPIDVQNKIINDHKYKFVFSHTGRDGTSANLEALNESDGTIRIFSMLPAILSSFMERSVYIIDELDHNLHPHIADFIVKIFNDKSINKVGSQLIFSTHNINIMSPKKLRKDQIFLTQKEKGETHIFSLDEFDNSQLKSSSIFYEFYDSGRLGGIPDISYTKIKRLLLKAQGKI